MRRFLKPALIVVLTTLTAGIFLKGTIPQPAIGNWLAAGSMTAPRSGAASGLLQDGRILITGGDSGAGPVASAEVFDTTGSFLAIAPMGTARSAHSATVLIDGRVLVAGGSTGSAATNAAEIFDPGANAWTPVAGGMIQARAHHTASLLADGRVLFAGGDDAGAATASLEIFDPVSNAFSSVGVMISARTSFASAILSDGRVMLIGGSNGSAPVASTEIFDPVSNSFAAGPALSAPRMAHSATTLLDGRVLVAGGATVITNPDRSATNTDLASAEIYDPATGNFAVSASSLAAPRRDHAAFLLPNNNSVLIVGGTSAGAEVGTAEMFLPSTGAFAATGSPSVARQHATGSALSQDGILFLAGGSNSTGTLATTELYGFATVKTDKADYAPGSIVTITGSGWQPGETVTLTMVESPFYDSHGPFTSVADSTGKIFNNQFSPDEHDISIRFYLTAVGSQSGYQAQNTFTDANNDGSGSVNVNPTAATAASTGNSFTFTFSTDQGKDLLTGAQVTVVVPTGWTTPQSSSSSTPGFVSVTNGTCGSASLASISGTGPWTVTININCAKNGQNFTLTYAGGGTKVTVPTAAGPYVFATQTKQNGGTLTPITAGSPTVTVNAGPASAANSTVTASPTTVTADGTTTSTITVTLKDANNNLASGRTVALAKNGGSSTIATVNGTTNASGQATFTVKDTVAEAMTYTATDTTDSVTVSGTATVTFTAGTPTAGNSTISASPASIPADGATTSTIAVTLKDANNNPVSGKIVTLAQGTGSSSISAASGASSTDGVVTFTVKDTKAETATYTATDTTDTITVNTTATVTFTAGAAAKVQVETAASGSGTVVPSQNVTAGTSITVFAIARDAHGNFVSNTATNWSLTNVTGGVVAGDLVPSGDSKSASFAGHKVGTATIHPVTSGLTSVDSGTITVVTGAVNAATSIVTASPTPVVADGTTTSTITVTLKDGQSNPVSGKTVALAQGTGSSTISPASGASNASGVVTFTVKDTKAETVTYTATDSTDAMTISQTAAVTFTAGPVAAGNSTVSANPTSITADGTTTATITVTLKDANNNPVSGKTVTLAQGTGSSTISAASGPSSASGVVTFTVKNSKAEAVTYTATDTTDSVAIAQTAQVTFTPGPLGKFVFAAISSPQTAGTPFNLTITAEDVNGNVVTGYSGNGFKAVLTSTGALTGTPITTLAFSSGVLSAFPVTITNTGSFTISAVGNGGNGGSGTSNAFTVNPGAASKLIIVQQPTNTTAGQAISPAVKVQIQDANGNLTTSAANVTIAIGTNPSSGTLSGTATQAAIAGVATFADLSINKAGVGYALTASGTGLIGATSSSFNVTARATSTSISPLTATAAIGQGTNFTVTVADTDNGSVATPSGNVIATSSDISDVIGSCTLAQSVPGTATCVVTVTSTAPAGVHIIGATFTASDNIHSNSNTTTNTSLTVNKASTTTTVGTISPEPSNINQSYSVAWSVTVNAPGGGTPTGTVTVDDGNSNTCSAAVAAGSCSLASSSAGTKTITATYSGDSNFTGSAGTKSHVVNNPATTTMVSSSLNPSTFGQAVMFTATVTSAGGTPTGNVTFYDSLACSGTVLAGPANLDGNGKAAFSTSALNAASHTITACYTPTGIYLASSGSVTQVVNQATATLSFDNLTFTYDGTPKPVTVTTSPAANLTGVTILYDGSATPPTAAGSTHVSATLTNANYTATPINETELILQASTITSAATTTFIAGTAGAFNVATMGFPTASLMETGALPNGVLFTDNGNGTATLAGTAKVAGSYPITIAASNGVGSPAMQAFTLVVTAGDFTKLQLLVPGETAAPGTASGKTGTPNTEYVNGAFNVIVNAVDVNWNVVTSVTDTVNITSTDTDPNVKLPANAALVAGAGTFSVTLQTVSYSPATTTLSVSDVTDSSKTANTSPAIEVIVVYTAGIVPTMVATGDSVAYTLTVNNAASPNTNTLRSVTVAIPAEGGTPSLVSVTAANAGPAPANWTADLSQISSHLLRFTQNTATDGVAPGGTISIQFTATATNPVTGTVAQNVWTTTAFSDAAYTSALPLAGTEPTVGIGARPVITSADHSTNEFTYGAPGTFTITTSGFPTPSLTKSGSLPGGVTFTDKGDGTATLAGTPTMAGSFQLTITARNGYGSDAVQTFTLTVNKAIVMPGIAADDKDYDGTTAATIHCTLSSVLSADTANVTCSGTGNFADANAGMGKTVTSSNLVLGGSASGNYTLSTTTASTTAKINPRAVTVSIVGSDKVYNGKNTATITACTIPGKLGSDDVACSVPVGNATFASANASPNPQTVTATGIILTGTAAGNYTLGANTSATTMATISPAMLTITAGSGMMTYGGAPFVVTPLFEGFAYGEGFSNLTTQPACLPVFTSTAPSGTYITTCTGAVDSNYAISYKPGSVLVNQATTTTALTLTPSTINYGQTASVSATVSPQFSGAPTGTVSVSDGIGNAAGDSCTITLVGGTGTCNLTPSAATSSPATVSGGYSGDTNFIGSSGSAALTVNPAATSTSVSSSKDPSNYGDSLTFTATVTDSTSGDTAVPTGGTVQFVVDGTNFGSPVNLTAGTATSSATTSLAAGQYVVTAVFAGDTDFTGSTSPFLIQTVANNLSSIAVNPLAPTIVVGQSQRFTGTGTFADGSSVILPPGSAWAIGISMTNPVSAPMAAAGNNGTTSLLYFFGGQDGSGAQNFVQTYNPTTGVWGSASNSGFTARSQGTAVASSGLIYVIGGSQSSPTNTVEAYDPVNDSWATRASMPHVSACSVGGAINGLIYVLTGCDGNPGFSKEFDVYNAATNTWSSLTSPTHTHNSGAGVVINGKFYVAAGYDQGTGTTTNIVESYDPQTSTWTTMTAMPAALGQLAGAVVNQQLYAIGGVDGGNSVQSTVYVYDPTKEGSNPWSQLPSSLSQGRSNIGAAAFDGLLYAAGGGEPTLTGMLEIADTDDVTLASDNTSVAAVGANTGLATGVTPGATTISAISATYSISGKAVLTVIKANTTTSLSSSLSPSTYGQAVTFTATVSVNAPGAGTPTGSVSLYDGGICGVGTTLASGLTLTSGSVTFTTSSLSAADSPHSIIACYSGDTNFNATGTSSSAATPLSQIVNPAVLTVTANPQTKVYGLTDPVLTYVVTGFQLSDTAASVFTGTLTRSSGETVAGSPYAISQGTLTANSNYKISFTGSSLAVTRAPASVTPAAVSKIYGAADPGLTGTLAGFLTADAVTATYTRVSGETVTGGPYAISATLSPTAVLGNYNITYNTASFTINPAPLTITASSGSFIYGGPVYPVTPMYGGFTNGDKSTNLTTPPSCGTTATSMSPVIGNPYVSSCSGAVDSNYIISYAPGVVTVSQATTTTAVVTSVNPSTFMQLVTFTATVTPLYSGTVPTGTVTFYNNGSSIGTSPVSVTSCGMPPCPDQAAFNTSSLPDSGPDNITATYNGDGNFMVSTSPAIVQTVQPAPNVSLNPMSVSFGNQNVNTTSKPAVVTLSNIGDATLNISTNGISITPSTDFTQTNTCGSTVLQGKSCTISIAFTPVDTGIRTATLQITDNDDDATSALQTVSLTGAGLSTITGTSLYTDAIFATANGCGSIVVSGGSTVDSFNSTQGFAASHLLSGGNVGTNGNVTLNGGKSAIYGSAAVPMTTTGNCSKTSLTGVTTSGGAQVTGGLIPLNTSLNYPVPPAPTPAPPTNTQNISGSCGSISTCTNTGTKTISLAPGQYGNLNISGGTTAHFSKGAYNINSLSLTGQSILYVDSGPVVVNLAGASLNGGNAAMDASGGTIQNPSGNPANLQFTYAGSRGLNLSGGSASYATVDAPNALVNISGGSDFFGSIIASTVTNSGGTALHGDTSLPAIASGNYIWFNAVVNNVSGLPSGGNAAQVKLYLTNSTISFTANGTPYSVSVPNAVVTFNSSSQSSGAKTSYDLASSRWSTSVAKTGLTGNTFVTGIAFAVPSNFSTGIQNVAWSTSFSTDTPGITLQWQWAAAVYSSFSSTYATASPLNTNLLAVNAEDGSANMYGTDSAGTPEAYRTALLFGATGGGGTNYTGYFTPGAGVVPTVAPMSVSPSSLDFGPQNQGTVSTSMTTVLTNNDSAAHTIFSIAVTGTNAANFIQTNNCPTSPNALAGGASCTIAVTFTPSDVGARTAKVVLNDNANNSPQTVYLSGTGQ